MVSRKVRRENYSKAFNQWLILLRADFQANAFDRLVFLWFLCGRWPPGGLWCLGVLSASLSLASSFTFSLSLSP